MNHPTWVLGIRFQSSRPVHDEASLQDPLSDFPKVCLSEDQTSSNIFFPFMVTYRNFRNPAKRQILLQGVLTISRQSDIVACGII